MKILNLNLLAVLFCLSCHAFEDGQLNINAGLGAFGSRGIVGVSADRFVNENNAISLAAGLDMIGPTVTLGWKYFDSSIQKYKTGTFLDKCFFLFECESHPYFGIGIQGAGYTNVEIKKNGESRKYSIGHSMLGIASLGFRDVFSSRLTFDLEITYRSLLNGGQISRENGIENNDDLKDLKGPFNSVGIGIALGYLF